MTRKVRILAAFGVLGCGLAFSFTNCSQVDFQAEAEKASSLAEVANDGEVLTPDEIDDFVNQLPPSEQDTPRPVTDLETDPSLYTLYKCPDSDGVVICHFPEEVTASATKCVGRPAVDSHYDHIRNYTSPTTNQPKTIGDYLGPCRFPL